MGEEEPKGERPGLNPEEWLDQWLIFHIASLPAWRYEDITTLSLPVVELAAEAQNNRRDEQNRFSAAIHGVKMDDAKKGVKNTKANIENMKASFKHHAKAKTATRAEIAAMRMKEDKRA